MKQKINGITFCKESVRECESIVSKNGRISHVFFFNDGLMNVSSFDFLYSYIYILSKTQICSQLDSQVFHSLIVVFGTD